MNDKIYTEASEWLLEFRAGRPDRSRRERFERWLCTSPEHVRAYLEQSALWETIRSEPAAEPAELEALIERARHPFPGNNVVLLGVSADAVPAVSRPAERQPRWFRRAWPAVAATALLAVTALTLLHLQSPRNVYSTARGEQRSILLSDGSTIDLNARSSVRVRFDSRGRHVDLIQGQALFHVAKDARRPFIVAVNGTRVRAVGTQFDINQRRHALVVTVVEGTVAVSGSLPLGSAGSSSPSQPQFVPAPSDRTHGAIVAQTGEILLDAGEQLTLTPAAPVAPAVNAPATAQSVDVENATAWTHRRLIFDTTPLEDVAAEFNRNSDRPIVVQSRGLEDFHVSGAFSSTDVASFLRFLRAQDGVEVIEAPDRIVIVHQ
jgi:transmembrane sensor